jgi:hypothetical protein
MLTSTAIHKKWGVRIKMSLVNPPLPTGDRKLDKQYTEILKPFLSNDCVELVDHMVQTSTALNSYSIHLRHCLNFLEEIKSITDSNSEHPIVEFNPGRLQALSDNFKLMPCTVQKHYAFDWVLGNTEIFFNHRKNVRLQYSPEHDCVLMKDVPYQGRLISNSPMIVNKELKDRIITHINTLRMTSLIEGNGSDIIIPKDTPIGPAKSQHSQLVKENLIRLLEDTANDLDLIKIALTLRLTDYKYSDTHSHFILNLANISYANLKIDSATRTNLIYRLGGYNLPDDYESWFLN